MSGTGTTTRTVTYTFVEQVMSVSRPVYGDLIELVDMYGQITREDAQRYRDDFRAFMNEQYLKEVELRWMTSGTYKVIDGLKYVIVNGEAVRSMDRPGGIEYKSALKNAAFGVVIWYTPLWHSRSAQYQAAFKSNLKIQWGPAASGDYSGGSYVDEHHQYGAASVGVSRLRFKTS